MSHDHPFERDDQPGAGGARRAVRVLGRSRRGLPPGRREAYLEEACAGEPEVRREVESLLTASEGAAHGSPLDSPDVQRSAASRPTTAPAPVITPAPTGQPIGTPAPLINPTDNK